MFSKKTRRGLLVFQLFSGENPFFRFASAAPSKSIGLPKLFASKSVHLIIEWISRDGMARNGAGRATSICLFSTTEAETGQQELPSTFNDPNDTLPIEAQPVDIFKRSIDRINIPNSTAVRLLATFPYIIAADRLAGNALQLGRIRFDGFGLLCEKRGNSPVAITCSMHCPA
jgi:hypothetical protein